MPQVAADRRAETRRSLSSRKGAPAAAGSPCFKTRFGAEQGNLSPVRYRTSFHVRFQRLMSHTSAALTAKAQQAVSTMRASTGSEPIVPIKS